MIGGEDIVIPLAGINRAEALESVVRSLFRRWTAAVFQDGRTGQRYETFSEIPFGRTHEILVYQDEVAFMNWETMGATPSTEGTMVHVIAQETTVTLVVDDIHDEMTAGLINEVGNLLRYGLLMRRAA